MHGNVDGCALAAQDYWSDLWKAQHLLDEPNRDQLQFVVTTSFVLSFIDALYSGEQSFG